MKHVYLFNEGSRAAVYGIGTYIRQLTACLTEIPDLTLHVVELRSREKEFTQKKISPHTIIYYFPDASQKYRNEYSKYYRNVFFILTRYIRIEEGDELVFHLNYMQQYSLIEPIREKYPNSSILYTIHYQNWSFSLKGNTSYFKNIIRKKREQEENCGELQEYNGMEQRIISFYEEEKKLYDQVDCIICLAKYTRHLLISEYSIPKEKTALIYNGLKDEACGISLKEQLKRELLLPKQEKVLLFVGRLDDIKGVDVVISAFKLLLKEDPDWRLIVVGEGNYSAYLNECRGYWSKTIFTGRIGQDELYKFYQIADVGVMPSTHEQCSYVAIEMMMFGVPIVVSTSTGLSEMLLGENRLYRVSVKQIDDKVSISATMLKNRIVKASLDQDYRRRIRQHYEKRYALDIMRNEYLKVYTKWLANTI